MGAEMTRAVLLGAAPCADWSFLERYRPFHVICADGGRKQAEAAGLVPDWYVGDSDSGGWPEGLPHVTLPSEKDVTDLEMAVDLALEQGWTELILCGCTGGRLDHFLGNVHLLEKIAGQGGTGILADPDNEFRFFGPGCQTFRRLSGYTYFSLVPLDEALEGVTLTGAKYPLDHAWVPRQTTLGISNEFREDQVTLACEGGRGLFIQSK